VVDGSGGAGGGGEYPLQDGFGWSNGVALRMMALRDEDRAKPASRDALTRCAR
jgi:alpha,alpha-trehalase